MTQEQSVAMRKDKSILYQMVFGPVTAVVLSLIKAYRLFISPLLGPRCRFYPTCSKYSMQAFKQQGLLHGGLLTVKRLSKCHPWHPGGIDELPECQNVISKPTINQTST